MRNLFKDIAKKAIVATVLAGAFASPAFADDCDDALSSVDSALQTVTTLDEQLQATISTLRETAVAAQASGNTEGCIAALDEIKKLAGLE